MAPSCTILEYLSRPNPKLWTGMSASGTLTVNDKWLPIEGVRPWTDFTMDILCSRYKKLLNKTLPPFDPRQLIEHAHLDEVSGEDTIETLVNVNNLLPVSNALHAAGKGYYGKGSKFFSKQSDGSPDWGLSDGVTKNDGLTTLRNFCPGDIKASSKWTGHNLYELDWSNYLDNPQLANQARPLEQAQHYGINLGTRYAWILTDRELVVIRIRNSEDDVEFQPPRPSRNTPHRRMPSDISTVSTAFSAMSIDHSAYSGQSGSSSGINPAPLEIARISWSAGSKSSKVKEQELTVNLSLFFLAQLAFEDRSISTSYPALTQARTKHTQTGPRSPPSSRKVQSQSTDPVKYWLPSKDIAWDVIKTDIAVYLTDALVEQNRRDGESGYLITVREKINKEELGAMIADLKADTAAWRNEGGSYSESTTCKSRNYYGRTSPSGS